MAPNYKVSMGSHGNLKSKHMEMGHMDAIAHEQRMSFEPHHVHMGGS